MSEQSVLHRMENDGYYLLPKSHQDSPGFTGLLVAIRKTPTGQHFDPEAMHLRLCNKRGLASWVTLKLHSPFSGSKRVCSGRVVLHDRVDKRAHFFTFGGSLEATSGPDETVYSLRSPAPILEITNDLESLPDQLDAEVEALLAECEAEWGSNDQGFAQRLAQIDPLQLYLASLQTILERYKYNRHLREMWHEFYVSLSREKEWLVKARYWPANLSNLEDLLAPN